MSAARDTSSGSTRGLLIGVIVVVLALAGATWLLSEDGPAPAGTATLEREPVSGSEHFSGAVAERPEPARMTAREEGIESVLAPSAAAAPARDGPPEQVTLAIDVFSPPMTPVPGARVEVWIGPEMDAWIQSLEELAGPGLDPTWAPPDATVLTDAQGRARVEVPARATVILVAEHHPLGTGQTWWQGYDETDGAAEIMVHPRAVVSGRVVQATDDPAVGVEMSLSQAFNAHDSPARRPRPVLTDADGRFELQVDAPCVGVLTASDGHEQVEAQVRVQPGEEHTVTLRLPGAFEITGVVWGVDGRGVPGAMVQARHLGERGETAVVTDATGVFRFLPAHPGEWTLLTSAPGLVQNVTAVRRVDRSQPSVHADLQLVQGAVLGGVVMLSDGTPLPDISVAVLPEGVRDDPLLEELHRAATETATSDKDGQFLFRGLHPRARYKVIAHGGGTLTGRVSLEGVAPGRLDLGLVFDVELLGGGIIRGVVLEAATGTPVPSFIVSSGTWHGGYGLTVSDADGFETGDGRFTLRGLEIGREHGLRVGAAGYDAALIGPVMPTADGIDVEILLGHPATLDVLVRDGRGQPVSGAVVRILPVQPQLDMGGNINTRSGTTVAAGTWTTGIPSGASWIDARHATLGRAGPVRIDLPDGGRRGVTLDLTDTPALGAAEVTLRDADDNPVVGVTVALASRDAVETAQATGAKASDVAKVFTDGQGTARFSDRAAGVHIAVVVDGDLSFPPGVVVVSKGATARTTLRPLF